MTAYVASTVPAAVARVSNDTLFRLAAANFGDALWWTDIAALNGLVDPWVMGQADILIPPVPPTGTPTGILVLSGADAILSGTQPEIVIVLPSPPPAPPTIPADSPVAEQDAQPLGMP